MCLYVTQMLTYATALTGFSLGDRYDTRALVHSLPQQHYDAVKLVTEYQCHQESCGNDIYIYTSVIEYNFIKNLVVIILKDVLDSCDNYVRIICL